MLFFDKLKYVVLMYMHLQHSSLADMTWQGIDSPRAY